MRSRTNTRINRALDSNFLRATKIIIGYTSSGSASLHKTGTTLRKRGKGLRVENLNTHKTMREPNEPLLNSLTLG